MDADVDVDANMNMNRTVLQGRVLLEKYILHVYLSLSLLLLLLLLVWVERALPCWTVMQMPYELWH